MSPTAETRPVPGWPGYSVSADGQVMNKRGTGPIRQEWSHMHVRERQGHLRVALYDKGRRHWRYVHMLVASAFLGPRPKQYETCHRDGDRTNNHVDNLYYGTRSENALDRERHKRELANEASNRETSVDDGGFDWETGE